MVTAETHVPYFANPDSCSVMDIVEFKFRKIQVWLKLKLGKINSCPADHLFKPG